MPRSTPWIILLCKFSDDTGAGSPRSIDYYSSFFAGDSPGSVPSFWRDITYGALDLVTGTEVTPWLTIPHKRSEALPTRSTAERTQLVGWAMDAGAAFGVKFERFFGFVAFFAVQTDLFGIPGDGQPPHVVCDVLSNPTEVLQEYGHTYGLKHSRSVLVPQDYKNPFCVMSGMLFGQADDTYPGIPGFEGIDPTFPTEYGDSGPGLCSPYLAQNGWLPDARVVNIASNGTYPRSTIVSLSALGITSAPHPQAAVIELSSPQPATIYVEYRHGGWDRELLQDPVVIHQLRPDGWAYYAGHIGTSSRGGGAGGAPRIPGKWHVDSTYDLSVELLALQDDAATAVVRVAPSAAARTLSVRSIADSKLGLVGDISVRDQVLVGQRGSLRDRLVELLGF